jgi:hypothetical protein
MHRGGAVMVMNADTEHWDQDSDPDICDAT